MCSGPDRLAGPQSLTQSGPPAAVPGHQLLSWEGWASASPGSGLSETPALDPPTRVTSQGPGVLSQKCLDGGSERCPHPERTENTGPSSALGRTECLWGPSGPTQKPLRAGGRFR